MLPTRRRRQLRSPTRSSPRPRRDEKGQPEVSQARARAAGVEEVLAPVAECDGGGVGRGMARQSSNPWRTEKGSNTSGPALHLVVACGARWRSEACLPATRAAGVGCTGFRL